MGQNQYNEKNNENKMETEYIIEQFEMDDENLSKVADLVKICFESNAPDEGGTISFTEETFRIMFGSPYRPKNLNVWAIYKPINEVVGFVGGVPRTLYYKGKLYKFGIPGFASVHPNHRKKNLATKMGIELMKIAKDLGFQGGFALFEPEEHGITTSEKLVREIGLRRVEILDINKFIIRVFDVAKVADVVKLKWYEKLGIKIFEKIKQNTNPRVRKYQPSDAEKLYELMNDHLKYNEMAFVREKDDFIWYLNQPDINCVVHENEQGEIDGFIVAWKMNLAGFGKYIPFGWLDLVHIYRLNLKEARDLCNYLCMTSKERGWYGLQTPYFPYFNAKPFKKANFIFFPKTLLVHLYVFENLDFPSIIKSIYMDWR
ncbi:MAG: GNAT family N-acetyltransferase [Promethearchaeota archaeon]